MAKGAGGGRVELQFNRLEDRQQLESCTQQTPVEQTLHHLHLKVASLENDALNILIFILQFGVSSFTFV